MKEERRERRRVSFNEQSGVEKTFGIPRRRGSGNRCKECGGLDAYRSNGGWDEQWANKEGGKTNEVL